jgi:hypothetical protein
MRRCPGHFGRAAPLMLRQYAMGRNGGLSLLLDTRLASGYSRVRGDANCRRGFLARELPKRTVRACTVVRQWQKQVHAGKTVVIVLSLVTAPWNCGPGPKLSWVLPADEAAPLQRRRTFPRRRHMLLQIGSSMYILHASAHLLIPQPLYCSKSLANGSLTRRSFQM